MASKKTITIAVGLGVILLFVSKMGRAAYLTITDWLIPEFEGFRANPYWDVSRYSWGYGTPAPGPTGTITKANALTEARKVLAADYAYLSPLITRNLPAYQWAALLSFSYNESPGNADNLIANINSGNNDALGAQWALYNKVRDDNGVLQYSSDLAARRAQEWAIWNGQV